MKKMIKNYTHNVIRLRKGKPGISQVYWIIVILNKNKTSSHKQVEQLGFFKQGKKKLFSINYQRLAYYLNKGYKLKNSVKKYIYWHSFIFNKYYKLNKYNKLKKIYKLMLKRKLKKKNKLSILRLFKHYIKVVEKEIDKIVKKKNTLSKEKALAEMQEREVKQAALLANARAYAKKNGLPFVYKSSNYIYKKMPPVIPKILESKDIKVNTKKINATFLKNVFQF